MSASKKNEEIHRLQLSLPYGIRTQSPYTVIYKDSKDSMMHTSPHTTIILRRKGALSVLQATSTSSFTHTREELQLVTMASHHSWP